MRRALASILIAVFSFPLFAAVTLAGGAREIPACCRRNGKHHCAMTESQPSGAPTFAATQLKCPLYPKANLSPRASHSPALGAAVDSGALRQFRSAITPATVYPRIASSSSALKRGPPSHA